MHHRRIQYRKATPYFEGIWPQCAETRGVYPHRSRQGQENGNGVYPDRTDQTAHPTIKDQPENPQRVWDDLYIIADFNLDINAPIPVPERDILFKKPDRVDYPQSQVRFKHYGKNIEKLVKEALKKEDPQERQDAIIYLGKLMKTFYGNWNKETLDDSVILKDIQEMSGGALDMTIEKVREDNLFEKLYKERKKTKPQQGSSGQHQRHIRGRQWRTSPVQQRRPQTRWRWRKFPSQTGWMIRGTRDKVRGTRGERKKRGRKGKVAKK